jgi:hypothetical protein
LIDASSMGELVEFFASGIKEDKMTLGVGAIRMCEAYQAPRPRLDVIEVFVGPALYGELALVDKSSFDLLKDGRVLKESLGLAGWTEKVLESLETRWLAKMVMIESFWRMQPSLCWFPPTLWSFYCIQHGDYFFNPDISHAVDVEVADLLDMQANGPVFLALVINTRRCSSYWHLLFSAKPISYENNYMDVKGVYKILISSKTLLT